MQAQAPPPVSENGARLEASAESPAAALDLAVDDWVLQADAAGPSAAAAGSNGAPAGESPLQQNYNAALRLLQSAAADSEVQPAPLSVIKCHWSKASTLLTQITRFASAGDSWD